MRYISFSPSFSASTSNGLDAITPALHRRRFRCSGNDVERSALIVSSSKRGIKRMLTVQRARKRTRFYHEQSRTNSSDLLLPRLSLNFASSLLTGRLPAILYVVHFCEADGTLAGRAFRLHDLVVQLCETRII